MTTCSVIDNLDVTRVGEEMWAKCGRNRRFTSEIGDLYLILLFLKSSTINELVSGQAGGEK